MIRVLSDNEVFIHGLLPSVGLMIEHKNEVLRREIDTRTKLVNPDV
jgi:hypothetical protein